LAISTSRRLGWKRIGDKIAPKLGISKDPTSTEKYETTSVFNPYDLLLAANEHVSRNYSDASIDVLLLKRTQLVQ
jgi:hypothetical protein